MTKSELRRIYLEKRRSLDGKEIASISQRVADKFFENFDLSTVKKLHCFLQIAKFGEIDTSLIYEKIWVDFPGVQIIVPRVDRLALEMHHLPFERTTQLVKNEWGLREPLPGPGIDPSEIDVVLVPLLCFDASGHRLGYGKGFYDRFLTDCRTDCQKVGLSHFLPVERIGGTHTGDVPLDFCITPDRLFRF